jgi:probable F420-dependent oxidoreductase
MIVESMLPLDDWKGAGPAAQAAEEAGFDAVMTAEISHDPFTPLAFAALATERIQLGTGIVVAFPRSPMVTAGISWDLQAQSGGRFVLGLGSQVKGHIRRRFSTEWTNPVSRMREYIQSLRAIWKTWETGEKLDFEGEHYRFSLMTPLPLQPDDAGVLSPADRSTAGSRHDRGGRSRHDQAGRAHL